MIFDEKTPKNGPCFNHRLIVKTASSFHRCPMNKLGLNPNSNGHIWGTKTFIDGSGITEQIAWVMQGLYNGKISDPFVGQGRDTIMIDELACSGVESTIFDCPHNGFFQHDCSHNDDVWVDCSTD